MATVKRSNAPKARLPRLASDEAITKARTYLRQGKYREAVKKVDLLLEQDAQNTEARKLRTEIVRESLWQLVREGKATWNGGKPKVPANPVPVTPGRYVSDLLLDDRI